MTLRDYFAAKAMQAEIVTTCLDETPVSPDAFIDAGFWSSQTAVDRIASNSYLIADAMLRAREGK